MSTITTDQVAAQPRLALRRIVGRTGGRADGFSGIAVVRYEGKVFHTGAFIADRRESVARLKRLQKARLVHGAKCAGVHFDKDAVFGVGPAMAQLER